MAAVAMAGAHDINNELTIMLNAAAEILSMTEPGDPMRLLVYDMTAAMQRCAWKTSAMLNAGIRYGYPVQAMPVELLAGIIAERERDGL